MLAKLSLITDRLLGALIAICLSSMVALVFTNVVLRYALNSGITISDELSRFFFVWLTFFGAILALRKRQHVGVVLLREKSGPRMRFALDCISELTILACSLLLVKGSWSFTILNHDNIAPLSGLPMSFVFGVVLVSGISFAIISAWRLIELCRSGKPTSEGSAEAAESSAFVG